MTTVGDCIAKGEALLPVNEIRRIAEELLDLAAGELAHHASRDVYPSTEDRFFNLVERRVAGEPLAYLLNQWSFWNVDLIVSSDVLIPRPETEHLVEAVLPVVDQDSTILDLGTGSGAIAIAIALETHAMVHAADISIDALAIAKQNARRHGLDIRLICSNWFDAIAQKYDVIVSNPPYVESNSRFLDSGDLRFEPAIALESGPDGLDALRHIIAHASTYLVDGGHLVVEHGYRQSKSVRELFRSNGFALIQTTNDLSDKPRVTQGSWFD